MEKENREARGGGHRSPPYSFYVVALALILASVVFVLVMWIFGDLFKDPKLVVTALSTLFGAFTPVVGAYFGIKLSSDTVDKTRDAIDKANDRANRAFAALPPNEGKRIMDE